MDKLDLFYIMDNNFADIAGVSITSVFMNNPPECIDITAYLLTVDVSEQNKIKFNTLAKDYGQNIVIIDAKKEFEEINSYGISSYRGSGMTNLRLLFEHVIHGSADRLLYIDCDTIVCGSLLPLVRYPLYGKVMAMSYDSYARTVKQSWMGVEKYYGAGVILIDPVGWREKRMEEKIVSFLKKNDHMLAHPDQDVLNIVGKDEITLLHCKYNFQATHMVVSDKVYYACMADNSYYSAEEIDTARNNPVVIHMIKIFGENPWNEGNHHPNKEIYRSYKEKSLWREEKDKPNHIGFVIKVEKILKKILPEPAFARLQLLILSFVQKINIGNKF